MRRGEIRSIFGMKMIIIILTIITISIVTTVVAVIAVVAIMTTGATITPRSWIR